MDQEGYRKVFAITLSVLSMGKTISDVRQKGFSRGLSGAFLYVLLFLGGILAVIPRANYDIVSAFFSRLYSITAGFVTSNWVIIVLVMLAVIAACRYAVGKMLPSSTRRIYSDHKEAILDLVFGHCRFKLIRDFQDYCDSCRQMMERVANRQKTEAEQLMYTIQTPANLSAATEDANKAYQKYMWSTNCILLKHRWRYKRLVYLPFTADEFAESFVRSYGFVRTLLFEYFFCYEQGSGEPIQHGNAVRPLSNHYPYGAASSALRFLRKDAKLSLAGIELGYSARTDGLLDICSRLDLHLPPSHEYSIAFSNEHWDEAGDGVDAHLGGNGNGYDSAFVGCIRVYEPTAPNDQDGADGNQRRLRERLAEVLAQEWVSMDSRSSVVRLGALVGELEAKGLGSYLVTKNQGTTRDKWREIGCDLQICLALAAAAKNALDKYPNERFDWVDALSKTADRLHQDLQIDLGAENLKTMIVPDVPMAAEPEPAVTA